MACFLLLLSSASVSWLPAILSPVHEKTSRRWRIIVKVSSFFGSIFPSIFYFLPFFFSPLNFYSSSSRRITDFLGFCSLSMTYVLRPSIVFFAQALQPFSITRETTLCSSRQIQSFFGPALRSRLKVLDTGDEWGQLSLDV